MKPRSVVWMLFVLALAGEILMSGCRVRIPPTPVRSFSTTDLLIDLSVMPEGWKVSEHSPSRILDELTWGDPATADEASRTVFLTEPYQVWYEAAHNVYRLKWVPKAKGVYESRILGDTPPDWTSQGAHADASKLLCRPLNYEDPSPAVTYCEWSAYYEEYYVEFVATLVPGKMTLEDVARIVQVIDGKMARYVRQDSE